MLKDIDVYYVQRWNMVLHTHNAGILIYIEQEIKHFTYEDPVQRT